MNKIYALKQNHLVVGRGATGIYLILNHNLKNAEVLVPANICYAAVFPVVYSGNIPKFYDVDVKSGNPLLSCIKDKISPKTKAIIVAHMYGNPVTEIKQIAEFCYEKNILLIEDCASSMGAQYNGEMLGSFGDYAIFSTGYSKTLDLGNGGIVLSDHSLEEENAEYKKLPMFDTRVEYLNKEFSQNYRKFRNSKLNLKESELFDYFHQNFEDNFLYQISEDFAEYID